MTGSLSCPCLSLHSPKQPRTWQLTTRPSRSSEPSPGPDSLSSAASSPSHPGVFFQDSLWDLSLTRRKTRFGLLRRFCDSGCVSQTGLLHHCFISHSPLSPVSTQSSCPSLPGTAWPVLSAFIRLSPLPLQGSRTSLLFGALRSNLIVRKIPDSRYFGVRRVAPSTPYIKSPSQATTKQQF